MEIIYLIDEPITIQDKQDYSKKKLEKVLQYSFENFEFVLNKLNL